MTCCLLLYAEGDVDISDGDDLNYTSEWMHVQLVGEAAGTELTADPFEVAKGEAVFQVRGRLAGAGSHIISAKNASVITIDKRGSNWFHSSFSIVYTDDDKDTWTFTVGNGEWESDPI